MGANDFGGEIGHMLIDWQDQARLCGCGQKGHLEAYCSATAVRKRLNEVLASGRHSSLQEQFKAGVKLDTLDLFNAASAGDQLALDLVQETARYLGIGITSILHIIDPEITLIGGAMTFGGESEPLGRQFLAEVRAEIRRRAMPIKRPVR